MTIRIASEPFTDDNPEQWNPEGLGPVWIELSAEDPRWRGLDAEHPLSLGFSRFIRGVVDMAAPDMAYGAAYAVRLGPEAVSYGAWHFDLGEYDRNGAARYVATWASDDHQLQNEFDTGSQRLVPHNSRVVEFNEGTDYHRRKGIPARPGQWGVFMSMALYRDDQPANLDCPRVSALRDRGPRGQQAQLHKPVARTSY